MGLLSATSLILTYLLTSLLNDAAITSSTHHPLQLLSLDEKRISSGVIKVSASPNQGSVPLRLLDVFYVREDESQEGPTKEESADAISAFFSLLKEPCLMS